MEMQQAEPEFDREMEEKILCENSPESIGTCRADFVVENKVMIDIIRQIDGICL